MKITIGIPKLFPNLKSVLEGGIRQNTNYGYPDASRRHGFSGKLAYMLEDSLTRHYSIRVECRPQGPVAFEVEGGLSPQCELLDAVHRIEMLKEVVNMLQIQALRHNPFLMRIAQGTLELDCSIPNPASRETEPEHLLLRATYDIVGPGSSSSTTLLLMLKPNQSSTQKIADFNHGRLGQLEPAIAALTGDLLGNANILLIADYGEHILPIIGWTDNLAIASLAIDSFVETQLISKPGTPDDHGLVRLQKEGLGPLTLNEPLFRRDVAMVQLC